MRDQDEDELGYSIQRMIDRALKALPGALHTTLIDLVLEFSDIFRVRLGNDPPVEVPPMKVEFKETERQNILNSLR